MTGYLYFLFKEVEAELARRQQAQASLGPADLDSLVTRGQAPVTSRRRPQSSVSRGGPQSPVDTSPQISAPGAPGRGRLQVLDNRRPALQPQFADSEGLSGEFESTLNTFRQRNRG